MKKTVSGILYYLRNISYSIGRTMKDMAIKIDRYIEERIDIWLLKLETSQPHNERRLRERVQLGTAIIFCGCTILFLAVPLTGVISAVRGEIIEHSIKSPNEIMMSLEDKAEFYPEIEVISGEYIPEGSQGLSIWEEDNELEQNEYTTLLSAE